MSRVILVFGDPRNGKTTLTDTLCAEHGFHRVTVDDLYVAFVATEYPNFFLPELRNCILQHYDYIFSLDPERRQAWYQYLLNRIAGDSEAHPSVVVEGYQLYDCKDAIETALKQSGRRVFQIKIERFGASLVHELQAPRLTPTQIAALGND